MKSKIKAFFTPTLVPAMRATMGDRWYYVATMTFKEIAQCVQKVPDIHEKKELKTWIQRALRPERTAAIATYLNSQSQHFFNAIVLGIYGGEPEWLPVAVKENLKIKSLQLDERQANAFGMVHLSGEESIFAIDGQHRVEGIRAAVTENPSLDGEEQVVIFVAHKKTDDGRERTRRLFSTLNAYAKPVAESELVALSEDDAFAIVTRRMIDEYPGLNMRIVPLLPNANIPPHEKTCITTVVGLYQLAQFLAPLEIRRAKKKHKIGPATEEAISAIFSSISRFWDVLKKEVEPIRKVLASDPNEALASKYRRENGGHILFRNSGLSAFARACRILMDRGKSVERAVHVLTKVPMELDDEFWREVLWRPETKTMLHKYVRLAQNMFLYESGETPDGKKYSVLDEYQRITGRKYPK